ncbi:MULTISPECIES: hypothetical protein [unclassified Halomonas]
MSADNINDEDELPWDWTLKMSAPERAIMEAMDESPQARCGSAL